VHEHDGFYLRLGLGYGYMWDNFASNQTSQYAAGTIEGRASGGALGFDFAMGGTVAPGFVLGGAILANTVNNASSKKLDADGRDVLSGASVGFETLNFTLLGIFTDYYIDPQNGWHIEGALGIGVLRMSEGLVDEARVIQDHNAAGIGFMLGFGYEWWIGKQWSLGPMARVMYGSLSSDDKTVDGDFTHSVFAMPMILLGATYH
jgi:outer membrane autotransporter protein